MFVIVSADTNYNSDVKCILGLESYVVYNTVVILAMSYMGSICCVTHEKMNVQ